MPHLFDEANRLKSPQHTETTVRYEIVRTMLEFLAAICFIFGSALFLFPDLSRAGTWLFLIGSILFAVVPAVRLVMEIKLNRLKEKAAEAAEEKHPL